MGVQRPRSSRLMRGFGAVSPRPARSRHRSEMPTHLVSQRRSKALARMGVTALLGICASVATAGEASFSNAVRETKPIIDLRLRSESVEQDGFAQDAHTLTLSGRITWIVSSASQRSRRGRSSTCTGLQALGSTTGPRESADPGTVASRAWNCEVRPVSRRRLRDRYTQGAAQVHLVQ